MSHFLLRCTRCGVLETPPLDALACGSCGSALEVVYTGTEATERDQPSSRESLPGIWPLWERLPVHRLSDIVSLGEGTTPCLPLKRIGQQLGLEHLYAKVEYLNPTGSFKDRGTTVLASMARELGFDRLVDDSSGNAGSSLAGYAARAGSKAAIFMPEKGSPYKLAQVAFYGAELHPTPGDREAAAVAAREYAQEVGAFYAAHNWSPYIAEGMKSFAYEVAQQLPEPPENILFPTGNGSLLLGALKGFTELREDGVVSRLPRLHCVQTLACFPLAAACQGREWSPQDMRPSVAGGIAIIKPPRLHQIVKAVKDTGGSSAVVEEEDIIRWQRTLARGEGLFIEPTSAAAFAGLEMLVHQGAIGSQEVTLMPLTGFGLKDRIPEG